MNKFLDLATKEKAHTCNCQYNSNSRDDEPCCRCDSRHTNADRIRNMPDEELADFLSNLTSQCESNTSCSQHCYGCYEEYCDLERCLKWLQSEAE